MPGTTERNQARMWVQLESSRGVISRASLLEAEGGCWLWLIPGRWRGGRTIGLLSSQHSWNPGVVHMAVSKVREGEIIGMDS